jgi:hypothetical protein
LLFKYYKKRFSLINISISISSITLKIKVRDYIIKNNNNLKWPKNKLSNFKNNIKLCLKNLRRKFIKLIRNSELEYKELKKYN